MAKVRDADLVVLAAGRSSRLGTAKGLVEVKGRPWLELQLEAARRAGIPRPLVVLSPEVKPLYTSAIAGLETLAVVVQNVMPERGPFSSLQCGLSRIASGAPAFVLPVDVPAAGPDVWQALAGALHPGVDAVVPMLEGRGGHPVLLGAAFVGHLLALPPEAGRLDWELRDRSRRLQSVARVPVLDDCVLLNLNTPADWAKLARRV